MSVFLIAKLHHAGGHENADAVKHGKGLHGRLGADGVGIVSVVDDGDVALLTHLHAMLHGLNAAHGNLKFL